MTILMKKNSQPQSSEPDYSEFKDAPKNTNILSRLRDVAGKILEAEALVAKAVTALEQAKLHEAHLKEKVMPALMEEAESGDWTSQDGVNVKIKEQVFASISDDNKGKAFRWLEKHDLGDVIKREFTIRFGRGDEAWAKKFQRDLLKRKKPLNSTVEQTVHSTTLRKLVKDILQEGKLNLPLEIFGVHRRKVAEVNLPKEK